MYSNALTTVKDFYNNIKKDKGGNPYAWHIRYIIDHLDNEQEKIVASFHSVLEDGITNIDDLKKMRFDDSIIKSISILTKKEDEDYSTYIDRIINSNDIAAIKTKMYAIEDNMDLSRIKNPSQEDIDNVEKKCKPNYEKLLKKLGELDDRYKINKRK